MIFFVNSWKYVVNSSIRKVLSSMQGRKYLKIIFCQSVTKTNSQLQPYLYIFYQLESNTFPPKKFKQLLKQPKFTKEERQCLTLFGTEMVFSQKAVLDLLWKNVARTKKALENCWDKKCLLELRFLKVVDSVVSRAFSKIAWYTFAYLVLRL